MQIVWRLDEEMPLDPESLLGDIILSDGDTVLQEQQTYSDSWLDALITGLQAVQVGKAIRVEILEEPDPLVFEPVERGVRLSYRAMAIEVKSVEALHSALLLTATAFLQKLAGVKGWERNTLLHGIRDFVSNSGTFHTRAKVVDSLPGYTLGMAGYRHNLSTRAKLSMRLSFSTAGTLRPLQSPVVGDCFLKRL